MIRLAMLGEIGSGKSYVSRLFGFPIFNADEQVSYLYKNDKSIFRKLNKALPRYIKQFPIYKAKLSKSIKSNKMQMKRQKFQIIIINTFIFLIIRL